MQCHWKKIQRALPSIASFVHSTNIAKENSHRVLDKELHQRKLKLKHLTLEHELTPTHRMYPSQKINAHFT